MRQCRNYLGAILFLTDGVEFSSDVFAYLPIGHGDFAVEVNGYGTLGLLNDVAYAVSYTGAYLLEFAGGDIFDEVVYDCSVLGFKFTDLNRIYPRSIVNRILIAGKTANSSMRSYGMS